MKNFVTSLSSALERRHHIAQIFNEQGIDFEFFDAITPEKAYDLKEKYFPECCSDNISAADLACAMSHIAVWLRAKELGLKYVAIFEDDVYLGENATLFLNSSNWIPKNIDVIKLETFLTKIFLGDSALKFLNKIKREIFRLINQVRTLIFSRVVDFK